MTIKAGILNFGALVLEIPAFQQKGIYDGREVKGCIVECIYEG